MFAMRYAVSCVAGGLRDDGKAILTHLQRAVARHKARSIVDTATPIPFPTLALPCSLQRWRAVNATCP